MRKIASILIIISCVLLLSACDFIFEPSHTHDYTTVKHNENGHWMECECGEKAAVEFHKGEALPVRIWQSARYARLNTASLHLITMPLSVKMKISTGRSARAVIRKTQKTIATPP